ncbi:HAD family hydrolase, partial [Streptomyces sp. O3]
AGTTDAGTTDAGTTDAGTTDAGTTDRPRQVPRIAFFDVDETLLAAKTMLDFWNHWTRLTGPDPRADDELATLVRSGAARAEQNRAYYRRFAGVPLTDVQEAARQWYAAYRNRPRPYVTAGLRALARHREAGHGVVLVSGSSWPILAPVAQDLGADQVLCTEQYTDDGILTGEVRHPMIGTAKADAVTGLARRLGVDPADCYAYGDHSSDLAMLRATGNATVIGADQVLAKQARRSGWLVLPSDAGPKPGDCGAS